MGLFDAFGAGGGKLNIEPTAVQVTPGTKLSGRVSFTAGKRAQNITHIKLKFTQTSTQMVPTAPGPHGPQPPHSQSNTVAVCPEVQLAGAFATEPGNRYDFPFEFQLPAQMINSTPGQQTYRLSASADIDGEVDPGDGQDIQVVGGQMPMAGGMGMPAQMGMAQPMMGGMGMPAQMGGMPGQMGMPAQMGMQGQVPGMAAAAPMMAMAGAMLGAAMQGGMPGQMPGMPGQMPGMPGQMPGMPGQMPGMPGQMPGMPGQMPGMQQPAPIAPGAAVLAQGPDGQWYAARVVQLQNNMVGVDWDNPALGASSWVQMHQVQPQQMQAMQPMMGAPQMGAPQMGGMPGQMGPGAAVYAQGPDGQWYPAHIVQSQNNMFVVDWENPALGASAWVQAYQVRPR